MQRTGRSSDWRSTDMGTDYFDRVRETTGSRWWINNPTLGEIDLALEHGAMGCTTNPGYGGNLVKRAPDEVLPIVRTCLEQSDDDGVVAELVQRRLVGRICERFLPLYERTVGQEGFVSIQGAPDADTVGTAILDEGRRARTIAPNATPKIPATGPGFEAFDALVAEGSPVIITEVFSIAQVIEACERWLDITGRSGVRPPFFMAPITGILGDHLKKLAVRDSLDISTDALEMAGVLLSRECYRVVREREYPVTLLYGGARIQLDFRGLVGGAMAATINWSTAAQLIEADLPAVATIDDPVDADIRSKLIATFPEMRAALDPGGLALAEFEAFGPVQHFRDLFIAGWDGVLDMIRAARAEVPA